MKELATDAKNASAKRVEKKLLRQLRNASLAFELFEKNDRVMVALSGGKDSYTLLDLMAKMAKRLPFPLSIVAVHLDQQQPGYDGTPLREWLEASDHEFRILSSDTYSVVTEHVEEGGTYCSLCSRLRRGILYSAAEELGCNKIALGHHRDDSLETFLMNLFFSGKLQAMPAKYRTDDGRFDVIRPLMFCDENEIAAYASHKKFPILPCNLCGSQDGLQRQQMKELLSALEAQNPNLRSVMLRALSNIRPTHLLDPELAAVFSAHHSKANESKSAPGKRRADHNSLPIVS